MFGVLLNLSKAALALAVSPVAALVDVVTLPASAERNSAPFAWTARRLEQAGRAFDAACDPESSSNELTK